MIMRLLRGCSIVLLVLAIALFAFATADEYMNRDETLPTITADSDTVEVPCEYTEEQLLEGVTASDEKDGDLTSQILIGNFTRFIEPGVCDLNYIVFDSSGNSATLVRRVYFTDYHSPRFSLPEPLVYAEGTTNNATVRELFSASDLLDGDLTDWVTYVETDASYSTPGDYSITMEVSNSFGDTVSYAFPIHIYESDTQNVTIELTEPLIYVEQGASFEPLQYVASISDYAGNHYSSSLLDITSTVDTSTPGLYEVYYEFGQALENDEETAEETTEYTEAAEEYSEESLTGIDGQNLYGQMWLTVIVEEATA